MLVIRAEVWPGGDYRRARVIGMMTAANISNLADISDYAFEISEHTSMIVPRTLNVTGTVEGHNRKQTLWALVRKILNQVLDKEDR